jgi:hypothetical protein
LAGARAVSADLVGSSESEREVGDEQCPVHASAAPRVPHAGEPHYSRGAAGMLGRAGAKCPIGPTRDRFGPGRRERSFLFFFFFSIFFFLF